MSILDRALLHWANTVSVFKVSEAHKKPEEKAKPAEAAEPHKGIQISVFLSCFFRV